MTRLPENVDFDEARFPDLADIFHGIDASIAAIIASDPAFRGKPTHKRRAVSKSRAASRKGSARRIDRAAA